MVLRTASASIARLVATVERRLEWLAERPFVSLRATHPLHVERALLLAMDAGVRVSGRWTYAPAQFDVRMNPVTLASVSGPRLLVDAHAVLETHQAERGFIREPIGVRLTPDASIAVGAIDVRPAGRSTPLPIAGTAHASPCRLARGAGGGVSGWSAVLRRATAIARSLLRGLRMAVVVVGTGTMVAALAVALASHVARHPIAIDLPNLFAPGNGSQVESSPMGPQHMGGRAEAQVQAGPHLMVESPGIAVEQQVDQPSGQSPTDEPRFAGTAAQGGAGLAGQPQECRVIAQQPLASAGSYLDGDGWNRVQYWWHDEPEREVALPPIADGGYQLQAPLSGWLWVWTPTCTEEQMRADMIASVARRTAAGANTAGWAEWRDAGWASGPIAVAEGVALDGSTP